MGETYALYGFADRQHYELNSALGECRIAVGSHWKDKGRSRDEGSTARSGAVVGARAVEAGLWDGERGAGAGFDGPGRVFTEAFDKRRRALEGGEYHEVNDGSLLVTMALHHVPAVESSE